MYRRCRSQAGKDVISSSLLTEFRAHTSHAAPMRGREEHLTRKRGISTASRVSIFEKALKRLMTGFVDVSASETQDEDQYIH